MNTIDEKFKVIFERFELETLASVKDILARAETASAPARKWLTAEQLAEHWNLYGKDGQPTTASIYKWTNRQENPLPHAKMGDLVRYNPDEADQWAREEAVRHRKLKNGSNNGKC